MAGGTWWSKAAHPWQLKEREKERETERQRGRETGDKGHTLNGLPLPTKPYLLKFPPPPPSSLSYKSINGLIYP
jgi:hypothetical protein